MSPLSHKKKILNTAELTWSQVLQAVNSYFGLTANESTKVKVHSDDPVGRIRYLTPPDHDEVVEFEWTEAFGAKGIEGQSVVMRDTSSPGIEVRIGKLTMDHVFKKHNLTNLHDLQQVFDKVEEALKAFNKDAES